MRDFAMRMGGDLGVEMIRLLDANPRPEAMIAWLLRLAKVA